MLFVRIFLVIVILSVPLGAFVPKRTATSAGLAFERWADGAFPITWSLNATRGPNITGTPSLADVFRTAFQAWDNVSTSRISFTEGALTNVAIAARDGINLISVAPTVFTTTEQALTVLYTVTDPQPGQFPGQILEADILFNPNSLFSTDAATPSDRFDVQSAAVHEIGHMLGLDHSRLISSVMQAVPT